MTDVVPHIYTRLTGHHRVGFVDRKRAMLRSLGILQ